VACPLPSRPFPGSERPVGRQAGSPLFSPALGHKSFLSPSFHAGRQRSPLRAVRFTHDGIKACPDAPAPQRPAHDSDPRPITILDLGFIPNSNLTFSPPPSHAYPRRILPIPAGPCLPRCRLHCKRSAMPGAEKATLARLKLQFEPSPSPLACVGACSLR